MNIVYKEHTNLLCQKEIVSVILPSKQKQKKVRPYILGICGSLSIFHPRSICLDDFFCIPPCHHHHLLQHCYTDTQSAVSPAASPRHCQSVIKNHPNLELHRTFRNKTANISPPPTPHPPETVQMTNSELWEAIYTSGTLKMRNQEFWETIHTSRTFDWCSCFSEIRTEGPS